MSATTSSGGRSRSSGGGGGSDRNKDTTPIFTHSNYGNPAFTPQKVTKSSGSKNQSESRVPKPPKPPEKPILPYMRYSKRVWDSVKAQYPELKLWELGKKIGAMWKQLSEDEKQEYIDEYEAEKVEYEKALKAYHQTPAYQAYMSAKSKVKTDADVHETPSRGGGAKSQHERRIDIQPAEDEDDQDEGYTIKHLAYARYLRNHRLINEIFSDAVVPDVRSVVTTQRMQVLKRQVSSLTMHQTKLEAELQQMEEKFEAKKQRMVESSEAFQEELKRHCKPAVDEDTFTKMVHRMYDDMKRDRQRLEDPNNTGPSHASTAAGSTTTVANRSIDDIKPPSQQLIAPSAASQDIAAQPSAPSGSVGVVAAKETITPGPTLVVANKSPISASTTPPVPVLKSPPPHDSSSKTDPEPMDIEPTPNPSVPPPPPPASLKLDKIDIPNLVPTTLSHSTPITMAPNINDILIKEPGIQHKITQSGKVPIPTSIHGQTPSPSTHQSSLIVESMPTGGMRPTAATTPTPPPPAQVGQQQPQAPSHQSVATPTMPQMHAHHGPPPSGHPHMPPHMSHQSPPGMPGMASHSGYGNYGGPPHPPPPTGHTRSPYYQPQYGAHPNPQPYGQYAPPYTHYQQPYGPPPGSHYMNARASPQHNGGAPVVHYGGGSVVGVGGAPNDHSGSSAVIAQNSSSSSSANASSVSQQQPQSIPPVHSGNSGSGSAGLHDVAFGPSATHGGPGPLPSLIGSHQTAPGNMSTGIGGSGLGHIPQTTSAPPPTLQHQQAQNNQMAPSSSGTLSLNVPSINDVNSVSTAIVTNAANISKPEIDKHDAE